VLLFSFRFQPPLYFFMSTINKTHHSQSVMTMIFSLFGHTFSKKLLPELCFAKYACFLVILMDYTLCES
jgi:hypothetical protein